MKSSKKIYSSRKYVFTNEEYIQILYQRGYGVLKNYNIHIQCNRSVHFMFALMIVMRGDNI